MIQFCWTLYGLAMTDTLGLTTAEVAEGELRYCLVCSSGKLMRILYSQKRYQRLKKHTFVVFILKHQTVVCKPKVCLFINMIQVYIFVECQHRVYGVHTDPSVLSKQGRHCGRSCLIPEQVSSEFFKIVSRSRLFSNSNCTLTVSDNFCIS